MLHGKNSVFVSIVAILLGSVSVAVFAADGLPADTSVKFVARELVIEGNTLLTTAELLKVMPATYNIAGKPQKEAAPEDLFDLTPIRELAAAPGSDHTVTARTVQGFTRFVLAEYQKHGYSGVYVMVPAESVVEGIELKDKKLVIRVMEAEVSQVGVNLYSVDKQKKEKSYLDVNTMKQWSPVKQGAMVNEKKLDDFVNEMNRNPDKHVTATIAKGEGQTVNVNYDLYERSPWHYFIQADSSGTDKREWSPKVGVINTDLTGRMDRATVIYQAKPDEISDNYSVYGSYEVPLWTPSLRLTGFAGYSQFDTNPVGSSPFTFQGNGYFYGGKLRYNLVQWDKWFVDVVGGVSSQRSRFTPNLFKSVLASDIRFDLWDIGTEIYKTDEQTDTRFTADKFSSFGGSADEKFEQARTGTDSDFCYYVLSASRSQYLDVPRVHRIVASGRYVIPGERLTPAAMTTFGGLYSVRGYHEDEVVADGGLTASLQYEYDLIASEAFGQAKKDQAPRKDFVRRLAPVIFTDFGRAITKDHVADEMGVVEMSSIGTGFVTTIGDNFDGALYYGWALRGTRDTDAGDGRLGASLLLRW